MESYGFTREVPRENARRLCLMYHDLPLPCGPTMKRSEVTLVSFPDLLDNNHF